MTKLGQNAAARGCPIQDASTITDDLAGKMYAFFNHSSPEDGVSMTDFGTAYQTFVAKFQE